MNLQCDLRLNIQLSEILKIQIEQTVFHEVLVDEALLLLHEINV
jgi:hypothetical protein